MATAKGDAKHPFSITETESALTKTIENSRREGTLHILKQDQRGRPLQGAAYYLETSTDNGSSWAPAVSRPAGNAVTATGCTSPGLNGGCLTTGADGLAVFTGLRADDHTLFRVMEVKAPAGYSLMAEPLFVGTLPIAVTSPTINDSETVDGSIFTYTLYITATDSVTYRLPETGGTGFPLTPIGLLFLAVPFFIPKFKKFSNHHFKWWFANSPIRAEYMRRLKAGVASHSCFFRLKRPIRFLLFVHGFFGLTPDVFFHGFFVHVSDRRYIVPSGPKTSVPFTP